jgi:2-hydroxychromene-2-carboxylate isomerase
MKACNNTAPIEIRNKDKWINQERLRWARQFHIPMSADFPKGFPKPTIHLQRFLTSIWMEGNQETLCKALDRLYQALWSDESEGDLPDPKVFAKILAPVLGEDIVKKHVERTGAADVKKQLIQNTDQSLADGAFGLPWFVCENAKGEKEGFWGFDHLGQVARFMELDGKGEVRALL